MSQSGFGEPLLGHEGAEASRGMSRRGEEPANLLKWVVVCFVSLLFLSAPSWCYYFFHILPQAPWLPLVIPLVCAAWNLVLGCFCIYASVKYAICVPLSLMWHVVYQPANLYSHSFLNANAPDFFLSLLFFVGSLLFRCSGERCRDSIASSTIMQGLAVILSLPPFYSFWNAVVSPWIKILAWQRGAQGAVLDFMGWFYLCSDLCWLAFAAWVWRRLGRHPEQHHDHFDPEALTDISGPDTHWARMALEQAVQNSFRPDLQFSATRDLLRSISSGSGGLKKHDHVGNLREKQKTLILLHEEWLKSKPGSPWLPASLSICVRRWKLLDDSCAMLLRCSQFQLSSSSRMRVKFQGEMGVDAGGLTDGWFDAVSQVLAEDAGEPDGSSLLANGLDEALVPRPLVSDNDNDLEADAQKHLTMLLAAGRFVALAVLRERTLPLSLSTLFCKYLLRLPVSMHDVQKLDPQFYRMRVMSLMEDGGLDAMKKALGEPLTFLSAATDLHREPEELKPGGASTVVSEENRTEYLQLLCEARLCSGNRREIASMVQGFWDLLPAELLQECNISATELALMISGVHCLDVDQWKLHAQWNVNNKQLEVWFWQVVREMSEEQRGMLLHFTTGSSRLPLGGFRDLQPTFTVNRSTDSLEHLPHSHTCVNQILLPNYHSKEQLREKLSKAIVDQGFEVI